MRLVADSRRLACFEKGTNGVQPIDEERIQELLRSLDEVVPREGTVLVTRDLDEDGTLVRANQIGYLRLGIEFLKAAYAAPRSEVLPDSVELDLGYLTGFDQQCYSFERSEDIDESPALTEASGGNLGALIGGGVLLFFVASLLVGALTILGWLGTALRAVF